MGEPLVDYLPLQDAFGGPNYFELDPDALYEIHIDNTGDGIEDLTFQFQFQHALANSGNGLSLSIGYADGGAAQTVAVPFINLGDVATGANLNVKETYTVNVVSGPRRSGSSAAVHAVGGPNAGVAAGATTFIMPTDNIGPKSFPGTYATYAGQFVYPITLPNCATNGKMFVGQRAEPFAVNLGPIFDLIDAPKAVVTGGSGAQVVANPLAKKNITSIELELPASCLIKAPGQTVIGGWTTASMRQARVLNPGATYTVPSVQGGAWTQVSRLGAPLVNEVVIGLPDKDRWNSSEPKDDTQFLKYVTNPTLPAVIDVLFGPGLAPQLFPRADLVEAFLTGVPGVNAFPTPDGGAAPATCEILRLNTAIPPTVAASQNYLGAAGCFNAGVLDTGAASCDPAGFPNGRRPGDDVVDIALDVMEGALIGKASIAPAFNVPFTDGVQQLASQFDTTFPYLKTPTAGANGNGT
ncbi:MAG TPA: DUF4331 domain-containing protein [Polyangiaceae bacterium]|jgi:hypothetical protein|nr:DUF4331 domain-containing protein [Polyangiaceae bacterium]